nr:GTP-binding protein [Cryptomonas sp.]
MTKINLSEKFKKKNDNLILNFSEYETNMNNINTCNGHPIFSNTAQNNKLIKKLSNKITKEFPKYLKTNEKQNRRIWGEVDRVVKTSDIVFLVVDIRDPIGSWSKMLEEKIVYLKKKIVIILNKCDLVPVWIISKWLKIFSKKYTTIAFHCNVKNPFGRSLIFRTIKILREKNFSYKQKIVIGIVGHPNVGKSSLINALKGKKVTDTSPIPGQTKVWQFIRLFRGTFLIDSPGIIRKTALNNEITILRGETRNDVKNQDKVNLVFLIKKIVGYNSVGEYNLDQTKKYKKSYFFDQESNVKLEKGGKLNERVARNRIISDFLMGNIPWYSPIPSQKKKILNKIKLPWIIKRA